MRHPFPKYYARQAPRAFDGPIAMHPSGRMWPSVSGRGHHVTLRLSAQQIPLDPAIRTFDEVGAALRRAAGLGYPARA